MRQGDQANAINREDVLEMIERELQKRERENMRVKQQQDHEVSSLKKLVNELQLDND